jgi:hypothetical protein
VREYATATFHLSKIYFAKRRFFLKPLKTTIFMAIERAKSPQKEA